FIAEMGAKQPNDIKEICDLVHPEIGIITAVGPQHLESFGTIENVQSTKFELADSLPSDGLAVVNNDFDYIANRKVDNVKCSRYSVESANESDYRATDIEYTPQGTSFTISDNNGEIIRLFTKLVGRCNVSNLVAAVIVALHLGMDKEKIRYAISKIDQVEHRLQIRRTQSGITIIDDAYNSNPVGSAMALEVLADMKGGKRIIITPGMIELGEDQFTLNKAFGEKIAKSADVAIIVGEYNKEAISQGLKEAGAAEINVIYAPSFAEAQKTMLSIANSGDTVLYENDLPDTFK
ncbi:MAG: UDP-N-acetylmuramoyl-tripeptide--D-alanyl-D-alanine ligase, partial [Muribaculaceae bacterium]|nr:UDP-N-acetylmuramoyl-tripeptide--D-alanyl-D-alanine ligase [Muribaculaceae bacterium]